MRPLLRSAAALAFLGAIHATGQDLRVVAELPRAGAEGEMSVHSLAAGGPPFVVSLGPAVVNVWPAGRVSEPVVSVLPGAYWYQRSPVFGDFDGDGLLDLAVIADGSIAVLKGDGAGRFTPAATLATDSRVYSLAAGDFDGDGRADLVAVQSFQIPAPILSCFLSIGGFAFASPRTTVAASFGGIQSVTAGDVDGDGLADLAVSPGQGGVSIWKGAGDGTFTLSGQQFAGYFPGRVRIVDLDGDGRPDLVYENVYSMIYLIPTEVYKNDGGGAFHLWAEIQKSRSATGSIVADLDGDGRPEIAFEEWSETGKPYLSSWKLEGGTFTESRFVLPNALLSVGAAVDWDGDGRADLLLSGVAGLQVLGRSGARTDVVVVPVLLSTTGLLGSRFDSDLLLTNSGTTPVHATLRYTAAAGGGSGTVERDLAPGRQLFAPSAVGFLRDAGLPIATEGNVIGTLRIEVTGASSPRAFSAAVRTTTPAGAGVAYGGAPTVSLLRGPSVVPWLVETARDRTNLALVNAGAPSDGPVTLRVEVHAGDGSSAPVILPDVVLSPGAFSQIGRVLKAAGLAEPLGWARITRITGDAPYLAWAAVNDAGTGDGSFEPAVPDDVHVYGGWVVPSAVQTARYATEFVATNPGTEPVTFRVTLVATGSIFEQTLAPGATFYVPDVFAEFRRRGIPGAPAADAQVASPIYVDAGVGPQVYVGIRVSSAPSAGRSYGVFEPATSQETLYGFSAVVPDLRQDALTRSNLGLVNLFQYPQTFHFEIVNGQTGGVTASTDVQLEPNELRQFNSVLHDLAPGTSRAFARITPVPSAGNYGAKPFAAYAVVNDGPEPGQGTDDGSFVPAIPE
jgi:hypothetical protein